LFATPTRAKRRNCVFAPPPKIGRKKIRRRTNFFLPADFRPDEFFFGGFLAGPNFSAAAAKFGG